MNEIDAKSLAKKAITDEKLRSELLNNLLSKEDSIRFNSFNVLLIISQEKPELLYPQWNFFTDLLDSNNSYRRLIAIRLLSNLTKVDSKNKFEHIFEKFFDLLDDSVIIASHLASNSGKIVKAKPNLETKITNKLLDLEKSTHKHKDLIIGGAIEAFNEFFKESLHKNKIMNFVQNQKNSSSPKTRKIVKEFIRKWEGP